MWNLTVEEKELIKETLEKELYSLSWMNEEGSSPEADKTIKRLELIETSIAKLKV